MTVSERVEEAVSKAEDVRSLRAYLQGHLNSGQSPELLAEALQRAYTRLREERKDEAADLVLDGLDFLTGWCGPGMSLRVPERG
jgi:hypothetical protein